MGLQEVVTKALLDLAELAKRADEELSAAASLFGALTAGDPPDTPQISLDAATLAIHRSNRGRMAATWCVLLGVAKDGGYAPSEEVLALAPKMEEWARASNPVAQ